MEFNSLTFIFLYLPLFVILFYLVNKNSVKNALILVFSICFYSFGGIKNLILLLFVLVVTYLFSLVVSSNRKAYIVYLVIVITELSIFKYGDSIFNAINSFADTKAAINLIMPLGISFFTFTAIGYVSDVYRGKIDAEKNILNLGVFIFFFPTITSGPIIRYGNFKNYLNNKVSDIDNISVGLRRFIIGLGKKIILANQLALVADIVYSGTTKLSFVLVWYGTLAYMMQIYFDFSGYSDMAVGIAKMIGFEIPENFDYPYVSRSPQEFWRRWHISLSQWFRDYVYIPMGGNRVNKNRFIINTMTVWILTGIWHGSTLNFIIWGIYNGLILLLYKEIAPKLKLNSFVMWIITMVYVFVGWIIFRCTSITQFIDIVKNLVGFGGSASALYVKSLDILYVLPLFVVAFICCLPLIRNVLTYIDSKSKIISLSVYVFIFIICICLIISGSYSSFIYFNF